ncbi:type II CRISPR RNA-guided endonuclease Cas9 [Roseivirga sp. UBA1976]|uniref:type II CRISPR RNA-guided endonuclease Cas9 n=1 Tax=Roseivirga sp. UBA1976 TaxID=1947386 RepID=UPI00257BC0D6|nr:type II CRISPR RNA-guided endonuclease Cas9 [Roseivirga sp. UBA1976]|tara:strand:+ start:23146 stop:27354 length:4209 start_codon:yes stop_codon:yes gene_type:complete
MIKRVLGLDLGTNSIGWALVEEKRGSDKKLLDGRIIKLGVRVNPLTVDEKSNFEKGKPISTNANRTSKRSSRRNLQRFKLRREHLFNSLLKAGIITRDSILAENGNGTTHQTLRLRAKAAREKIELEELARVLFALNKKRGYKSSRKTKTQEDGVAVDGMSTAKILYDNNLTPGQFALEQLKEGKKYIPDFYRSDLQEEFDRVWLHQKAYYPEILTDALYKELKDKNKKQTWAICKEPFSIEGIKLNGNKHEQKVQRYQLRVDALSHQLSLEHLVIVLQEINSDKNKSSGYLGAISDRSKILYINNQTVGEYLWKQIEENPHIALKNQVFYRQDYLDEFEKIWETQTKFHKELNPALKEEIRDTIIFYQRKLKSQKGLLSFCEFESWEAIKRDKEGKPILNKSTGQPKMQITGHRVIPKSSPLFQEFKIWQNINNLRFIPKNEGTEGQYTLGEEDKQLLFDELNIRGSLSEKEVLNVLGLSDKEWKTNQPVQDRNKKTVRPIEGNRTNQALYNVYQAIAEREGYGFDWSIKSASEIKAELKAIFPEIGIDAEILDFDANKEGEPFDKQASYQLWHLLYSAEDDHKISEEDRLVYGNSDVNLKKTLHSKYGFKPEYAIMLANISLQEDHGSLSARAIRKILPFLQAGHIYSEACQLAGYNHSNSLTKEERKAKGLKGKLEVLPKNSLRNPVVEKILNQMINLINQVCDEYGKPDEIRIELARELKKSAKEREEAISSINTATKKNEEIRKIIRKDFGFTPTKNDVIRYRLWQELQHNGGRTIFTNQKIEYRELYSKNIDIEHIIPKALLFDDSFSNKTLAFRSVNLKKGDRTAIDFIEEDYLSEVNAYKNRVEMLYKAEAISKAKYQKLLMPANKLPDGFIERDLRNSQYIAKKAKAMLEEVFESVVPTTGSITDQLRADWDLINVMKELNLPKYKSLGLTKVEKRWDSGREKEKEVEVIKDWTKRNDHRHHAMDALTVAFTSHNHIQYINYLNARRDENHKKHSNIMAIEQLIKKDRKFEPPMNNFRQEAKKHLEQILVSFKTKNKVVTQNINKAKGSHKNRIQLTPRGQLHKETVYGQILRPSKKPTKLNSKFSIEQLALVVHPEQKAIVEAHLEKFNKSPELAFSTKTLKKSPLEYKGQPLKEVYCFEIIYTIRKEVNPDNFKDQKSIEKVVDVKQRELLKSRLAESGGNAKAAFSDLDKNPIWLNKEKGIRIKRVTITGVSQVEALHNKKDHFGKEILDENGNSQPADFVSTGNNHHIAIFRDKEGKLQESVVSFYEAVARINNGLPVIDKTLNADMGWQFLFTMKQNEMFVFPGEDFDPSEVDLLDEKNSAQISKHLFRVQKIASKNYFFRHHLETTVETIKVLNGVAYHSQLGLNSIEGIIKVRINHLGKIVHVGEY